MANIVQWNVQGLRANFEELRLLCNQYNPQVVAVQECQLRKGKIISLTGFFGITKSSPGDNATGGVALYVNKSVLFSEIKLYTALQAVAVRVSAKKTLTVCIVYLPPSLDVNFSDLEHLNSFLLLLSSLETLMLTPLFGVTRGRTPEVKW